MVHARELCKEAVRIRLKGIDLVTPDQYATVQRYGLVPSMTSGTKPNTIPIGLNRLENHDAVLASLRNDITVASAAKVPNVTGFLSHEFVPVRTPPINSLEQAYRICSV